MTLPPNPPPPPKKRLLLPLDGEPARAPMHEPPAQGSPQPTQASSGLKPAPAHESLIPKGAVRALEQTFEAAEEDQRSIALDAGPQRRPTLAEIEKPKAKFPWPLVTLAVIVIAAPVAVFVARTAPTRTGSTPRLTVPAPGALPSTTATSDRVLPPQVDGNVRVPKRVTSAEVDGVAAPITNGRVAVSGPLGSSRQLVLKFQGGQYEFKILFTLSGAVPSSVEF